jgi:hypothetical protein
MAEAGRDHSPVRPEAPVPHNGSFQSELGVENFWNRKRGMTDMTHTTTTTLGSRLCVADGGAGVRLLI